METYTYNPTGEKIGVTYPDGAKVGYAYDELKRLAQVTDKVGSTTYAYDTKGHLKEKQYPSGTKSLYAYTEKGQLESLTHEDAVGILDKYQYTYDKIVKAIGKNKKSTVSLDYNKVNKEGAYGVNYIIQEKMGAWQSSLYGNDTTCDVRDAYMDCLKEQLSNQEAFEKIFEEYEELIGDEYEEPLFWFALAETQWKVGRLTENVKERALEWIEKDGGKSEFFVDDIRRICEKSYPYGNICI